MYSNYSLDLRGIINCSFYSYYSSILTTKNKKKFLGAVIMLASTIKINPIGEV